MLRSLLILAVCMGGRTVFGATCPPDNPSDGYTVLLPHESNCSLFYSCSWGQPVLMTCPAGLHFNTKLHVCDWPYNAGCRSVAGCEKLEAGTGCQWSPASCISGSSRNGTICSLRCSSGYQLIGSSVIQCVDGKWNGTAGLGNVPSCLTEEGVAHHVVDSINKTLNSTAPGDKFTMVFVLDESGSVGTSDFAMEKTFAKAIVSAFPLSENRTAGVIPFDDSAKVAVPVMENSSCDFMKKVDAVSYTGGGTDIQLALNVTLQEMKPHTNRKTIVFLLTDGISQTDPTAPANLLKQRNSTIFTIGIGGYDRKQLEPLASADKAHFQLFYGISSFTSFDIIAKYLETAYKNSTTNICP